MQKWLCLLAIAISCCSCRPYFRYDESEAVFRSGDNMAWATDSDDSNWERTRKIDSGNVFWARKKVVIIDRPSGRLGMQISSFGAFEVYWDGKLIGENGKPGIGGSKEVPGIECSYVLIPDALSSKGTHTVAFRMTQAYHTAIQRDIDVKFENYEIMLQRPLVIAAFMNLMAGAFFVAGIYFFLLYVNSTKKHLHVLVFAVICLLFFSLLMIEYLKYYIQIPYTHFFWRLELVGWQTFAIAALVPLYFALQFNFKLKRWLFGSVLVLLFVVYLFNYGHYDLTARYYAKVMWFASMVVVLHSVFHFKKGSALVLVGLFITLYVYYSLVYDFSLFISFCLVMFCMLYLHSIAMKELEQEHELSLVVSSRLRLELLRKNIQPHFLKNTLTSLIDWVEEAPKEGAKFIQALSEEFDIMNNIAELQLITVSQELALCKAHIQVMEFRKEIKYELATINLDEAKLIPPAIFHTLLENGITHSIPVNGIISFEWKQNVVAHGREYVFSTIGENRLSKRIHQTGNGLAYIYARLNESYGKKWKVESNAITNGWMTRINIYENS